MDDTELIAHIGSLVDEEAARHAVGDDCEGETGDQRGQAEEQRDAGT